MPLAKHRPDFAELIAIAALQRKSIKKRQKKHYTKVRKENVRTKYAAVEKSIRLKYAVDDDRLTLENDERELDKEFSDNPSAAISAREALATIVRQDFIIEISDKIRWFLDLYVVRLLRLSIVLLAFLNLTYEAQTTNRDHSHSYYDNAAHISDTIVAVYFLLEGTLKLFAFYAHMDMHKAFDLKVDSVLYFQKSGILDIILGAFSLYFGSGIIGGWFRLLRVLMFSSFALDETPHLVVLVSGITHGMRSILSTCLLLFLVFMVYAAFGLYFFERNDPYHFGTIALAMWSFFELSTLDNWSQVLYVNMYGCDKFPAYYTVVNSSYTGVLSISRYGSTLMLPICTTPEKNPVIASIMFLSFIVICAFILVNLTLAAVTSGINVRLDRIKDEGSDIMALSTLLGNNKSTIRGSKHHLNSMLIADPDMLLMMLRQVWKEQDAFARKKRKEKEESDSLKMRREAMAESKGKNGKKTRRKSLDASSLNLHTHGSSATSGKTIVSSISSVASSSSTSMSMKTISSKTSSRSFSEEDDDELNDHHHADINYFEWRGQSMLCRDILSHTSYQLAMFGMIAFSALLVLVALQSGSSHIAVLVVNLILQVLFTIDLYVQLMATYPNIPVFFSNNWQCFDALVVLVTWIPVFAWGRGSGVLELLNILRIMRLLKLLRWIHELNVIIHSVASSAVAIFYVYVLIFGLNYHFAVAGVFLFAKNDPQHFGDLGTSFVTLFQVQSLDDWSEVARTNMYGCDYWGYDSGEEYYDSQCVSPSGFGWFAALYFVVYIMMGVMVLLSLFVGIIITSMELLKEGIKEENEVWEKVKVQQKRYNMRDATINNLLEIFDLIDVGKNGKLTLLELKPIFDIIVISEASQFSLFMMVDTDNSGQIDFAEFIELLYLVGKAYKAQSKIKKRDDEHKAGGGVSSKHTSVKHSSGGNGSGGSSAKTGNSTIINNNRKIYPTKLSVVNDEGEEEWITESAVRQENEEDKQRDIFDDENKSVSGCSEDSEATFTGDGKEVDASFFKNVFQKSRSQDEHKPNQSPTSQPSSRQGSEGFSRGNSFNDGNPSRETDSTGTCDEKAALNISFFQKEMGTNVSSLPSGSAGGGSNANEKDMLNISFFQKQMGGGSQLSMISDSTYTEHNTEERRKSASSSHDGSSEIGVLSRAASKAMELDNDAEGGGGGGRSKRKSAIAEAEQEDDLTTIYTAGQE